MKQTVHVLQGHSLSVDLADNHGLYDSTSCCISDQPK